MRAAAPGRRERRGERGFALLDVTLALAITALFALLAIAGFARAALRVHAAALTFDALMARVEAAAMSRAVRDAGVAAGSGLTLTARATASGTVVEVYQGRPQPGVALPLARELTIAPLSLDVTLAGTPFSIFIGGAGSLSARPGYDAASSTQTLATEPACPPGGSVEIVFRDALRSETQAFACADGARGEP
jgi:hypothetical protein